jgi:hypothetical protein
MAVNWFGISDVRGYWGPCSGLFRGDYPERYRIKHMGQHEWLSHAKKLH